MPNYAIYARVSTKKQSTDPQVDELREIAEKKGWTVTQTVMEKVSGAKHSHEREGLDSLLKSVTKGEIDGVAVWAVDRLGRSLTDLVNTMETIKGAGANLYIHSQGIDTNTPAGKAMFQMTGVFAEFEKSMIQERVRAGLEVAKANGVQLGRPKKTKRTKKDIRIENELKKGYSVTQVQIITKASRGTVSRIRQRLNANGELPKVMRHSIEFGRVSSGTTAKMIAEIDTSKINPKTVTQRLREAVTGKSKQSDVA